MDPIVESRLAQLLAVEDRPQSDPAVLEEEAEQLIGLDGVDVAALVGDAGGPLRTVAALAGAHSEAHLAAHIVELATREGIHDGFEHGAGDEFAFADHLIVAGRRIVVLKLFETVPDRVEPAPLGGRDDLVGRATLTLLTHLVAHDVNDALSHEPVGGEFAARNREHAGNAVAAVVINDAHAARHVAGIGCGDSGVFNEGARPRPGVQGTRLAESGEHRLACVEHLLNLLSRNGQGIGILHFEVGRPDDAHRVVGDDNVAVGWPDAPVKDGLGEPVIHRDHDARTGGEAPEEKKDVRLDLTVDAHIPESYVPGERLRLEVYGKIAAVSSPEQEADVREELVDRYGTPPREVELLFAVARLRRTLRASGLEEVVTQGKYVRINPVELRDSQVMRLKRLHPGSVIKAAVRQVLVPVPTTARIGGAPLTDEALLEWVETLVTKVLVPFGE